MSVTTPANQPIVIVRRPPNLRVYMIISLAITFTPCLLGLLTLIRHH